MCDVSDGFRLCSCDTGEPADWVLYRGRRPHAFELMRGFTAVPTEDDELQALFVLDGLQEGGRFDFDYTPEEGDVVTLRKLGPTGTSFEYHEGRWQPFHQEDAFELSPLRQGRLELVAEAGLRGEPVWEALIANPDDPALRAVTVDWLLETGRTVLARWFQLEDAVATGAEVDPVELRTVARKVSLELRARFAQAPLPCDKSRCPGDWSALVRTPDPVSRRCIRCRRVVELVDRPVRSYARVLEVAAPSVRPTE
ncbi:MAG: hypothetical protein H6734_28185 [Alphaproteobacteria bacterium]|nr:hypothetical protein [Alphaproteobacteria bacterium]